MKPCHTVRFPQSEVDREEEGIKLLKYFRECLRAPEVLKEMKSYPNRNLLQRFSVGERYRGTTPRVHAWHSIRVQMLAPTRAKNHVGASIPVHTRMSLACTPTRACLLPDACIS